MRTRTRMAWWLPMAAAAMLHAQPPAPAPAAAKAAPLEFTDEPHLTVEGIKDWTAVGGHGSDTTLRTSEELARLTASPAQPADAAKLQAEAELAHTAGHEAERHRLLGERAELLGDPLRAVHEDAEAAALSPTEGNLLQWGSELLLHRAVLQAAQVFADGVRRYPASAALRTGLGSALFAEARYAEAEDELCHAVDLHPGERAAEVALAHAALGAPEPAACAMNRIQRWAAASSGDAEASCYAGQVLLRHDPARAELLLHHAVELNPHLAEALLGLAVLATETHHNSEAEHALRAAIAADPKGAEAHFRLAVLLRQSGRRDEAASEFARHAQLKAEDAARVERERAAVKEFVIADGK